jgi:AcrR family transcriptional regulator
MAAIERRASIVVNAAELFAEQGFDRTTVRDLANRMGFQSGTIFHYFDDKRSILVDVIRESTVRTSKAVVDRLQHVSRPVERLDIAIRAHIESLLGDAFPYARVSSLEWNFLTPDEQALIAPVRDAYERRWDQLLDDAVVAGVLHRDPLLRLWVLGTCNSTLLWYRPDGSLEPQEIATRYARLIIGDQA